MTGYMPPEFGRFWKFRPDDGKLEELDDGPGEQQSPVVFATEDKKHAMGVFSPDQPSPGHEKSRLWAFPVPCGEGSQVELRLPGPQRQGDCRRRVSVSHVRRRRHFGGRKAVAGRFGRGVRNALMDGRPSHTRTIAVRQTRFEM